jgi:hypothetical protein
VLPLNPAPISVRTGWTAAIVLSFAAIISFGGEGLAQNGDLQFDAELLSEPHETPAPGLPPLPSNYTVPDRSQALKVDPKIDFGNFESGKDFSTAYKDPSENSLGRVPSNGGSFGFESEAKVDFKKIAPNESVDINADKKGNSFFGLSIVTPYESK